MRVRYSGYSGNVWCVCLGPVKGIQSLERISSVEVKDIAMSQLCQLVNERFECWLKKCNLTLAMSPTCHINNTIIVCWRKFFWECSQSELAQCQYAQVGSKTQKLSVKCCRGFTDGQTDRRRAIQYPPSATCCNGEQILPNARCLKKILLGAYVWNLNIHVA